MTYQTFKLVTSLVLCFLANNGEESSRKDNNKIDRLSDETHRHSVTGHGVQSCNDDDTSARKKKKKMNHLDF